MTSLLRRIGGFFIEPPDDDPTAHAAIPPPPSATPPPSPTPSRPSAAVPTAGVDASAAVAAPTRVTFIPPRAGTGSTPSAALLDPPQDDAAARPHFETATAPHRPEPPAQPTGAALVFGQPSLAIPVAAACAGELRARTDAPAAVLCVWQPPDPASRVRDDEDPSDERTRSTPGGATTPAARRLAARLAAHGTDATACGRLAWARLPDDVPTAAASARRSLAIAEAPVVVAVTGARAAAFDDLQDEIPIAIAVLPPDADPALRSLVLGSLPAGTRLIAPPLPSGPPRWAAMAGLGRLRSLPANLP